ncbi:hypothetical protein LA6_001219 [Marinibacterium anthonyi]|nr:hypothetical protein LA6_001219 [Marinibacterium anthonyi]
MKDYIDRQIGKIVESNEVPYIVPRVVLGGLVSYLIIDLFNNAPGRAGMLLNWRAFYIIAFLLGSWLVGYIIDTISISIIRSIVKLPIGSSRILYKSLEGYRFLIMTSCFVSGFMIASAYSVVLLYEEKIQAPREFDTDFFLVIFFSCTASVVGLGYVFSSSRSFSKYLTVLASDSPSIVEYKNIIEALERKIAVQQRDVERAHAEFIAKKRELQNALLSENYENVLKKTLSKTIVQSMKTELPSILKIHLSDALEEERRKIRKTWWK